VLNCYLQVIDELTRSRIEVSMLKEQIEISRLSRPGASPAAAAASHQSYNTAHHDMKQTVAAMPEIMHEIEEEKRARTHAEAQLRSLQDELSGERQQLAAERSKNKQSEAIIASERTRREQNDDFYQSEKARYESDLEVAGQACIDSEARAAALQEQVRCSCRCFAAVWCWFGDRDRANHVFVASFYLS
jgi:septal ring factor EnvC (AmiA/AmiB activator)